MVINVVYGNASNNPTNDEQRFFVVFCHSVPMMPNSVNKLQLCRFIRKSTLTFQTVGFAGSNKFNLG